MIHRCMPIIFSPLEPSSTLCPSQEVTQPISKSSQFLISTLTSCFSCFSRQKLVIHSFNDQTKTWKVSLKQSEGSTILGLIAKVIALCTLILPVVAYLVSKTMISSLPNKIYHHAQVTIAKYERRRQAKKKFKQIKANSSLPTQTTYPIAGMTTINEKPMWISVKSCPIELPTQQRKNLTASQLRELPRDPSKSLITIRAITNDPIKSSRVAIAQAYLLYKATSLNASLECAYVNASNPLLYKEPKFAMLYGGKSVSPQPAPEISDILLSTGMKLLQASARVLHKKSGNSQPNLEIKGTDILSIITQDGGGITSSTTNLECESTSDGYELLNPSLSNWAFASPI